MDQEFSGLYDEDVWECLECYLNLPELEHPENNPLSYAYIHEKQQEDHALLALQAKYPNNYVNMELDDEGDNIICYKNTMTETIGKLPYRIPWYQKLYDGFIMYSDTLVKPECKILCKPGITIVG